MNIQETIIKHVAELFRGSKSWKMDFETCVISDPDIEIRTESFALGGTYPVIHIGDVQVDVCDSKDPPSRVFMDELNLLRSRLYDEKKLSDSRKLVVWAQERGLV